MLGGEEERERAVSGSEAVVLKGASPSYQGRQTVLGQHFVFWSLVSKAWREKKDYNLHAKYVMRAEMVCERYKEGQRARRRATVYFLDGSIASPFLQAMILIF